MGIDCQHLFIPLKVKNRIYHITWFRQVLKDLHQEVQEFILQLPAWNDMPSLRLGLSGILKASSTLVKEKCEGLIHLIIGIHISRGG
jgi:hypothetical protein